jgi:hypothetical protein
MQVTSWLDNLPADDIPPENIWHHTEALKAHFTRLKDRRSNPSSGPEYETVPDSQTIELDNSDVRAQLMAP